ncbi:MAG: ZIP family metal transporter [Gammaproteobacteria bacterium]|nr:ZIP family metal transporter [Gammaproteobacteria bacterium]MCY4282017.1 ZIP family metal transporter [Gammaproteobacteria bacterium]MCY4337226.1 ZIP family metal transporter [Gammaproteobacteria bacterium]
MSLLQIKLSAALAILVVAILGGLIPLLAARHHASRRFLSLGNALAGGIFLGAGFIHLLPEAGEALAGVVDYPLAPLLAAVGVVALLLIDRVLFEASHAKRGGEKPEERQPIYPLVLLVVLSIHSIIAGIALGIETEVAASLLVMIAILSHKGSAAFALIISVQAAGAECRRLLRVLAIFAVMTPVGILLGTLASGLYEGAAALLIEGSFNALAAGTFVYVAILDVIDAEMYRSDDRIKHFMRSSLLGDDMPMPEHDRDRIYKFILIVIGLAGMGVLALWI